MQLERNLLDLFANYFLILTKKYPYFTHSDTLLSDIERKETNIVKVV